MPLVALAGLLAACAGTSAVRPTDPLALTVYGAASLKDALASLKAAFETAHPEIQLTISTDSSAALATKIAEGAPADVFLSADTSNPQKLAEEGFTSGEPIAFAGNELTVIVPRGNPGGVATPADLAKPGLKVIAAGDEAPITTYATKLVAKLAARPGYPADFADAYAANVLSKEDTVKGIVAKIELGEGDAGIVYVTDAAAASKVDRVAVPEAANVPATYTGVVVRSSTHQDEARAFLDWVTGREGQAILRGFGFLPPP